MRLGFEVFHPDVPAVVAFYVDALGFVAREADDPEDYVVVERDGVRVGCCFRADAVLTKRPVPAGSELVLRVEDVDAEHERVLASGWPIADELQERPWGLRDFRLFDPTGQYLRITSTPDR